MHLEPTREVIEVEYILHGAIKFEEVIAFESPTFMTETHRIDISCARGELHFVFEAER
jgi:hypothetical protein